MEFKKFKFIDLFSGVGGFHQSLSKFGGECVFASEIDMEAIKVYKNNYNINSNNDITKVDENDIPEHDVLCGGFPCQAFSKAGNQNGLNDTRGTLFFDIERILKSHKTKLIILENVRNLVSHDEGRTWKIIQENLRAIGYRLTKKPLILSPHNFGTPQLRDRVFIVGLYDPDNVNKPLELDLGTLKTKKDNTIDDVIDLKYKGNEYNISEYEEFILNAWDEFYQGIDIKIIGFPIWVDSFKAIKSEYHSFPKWKKDIVEKNINLYNNNKKFIDKWLKKYDNLSGFTKTHRKFEWQAGEDINNIWEGIIQLRPSGIRVKRPDVFPALVAMVQIPIIGKLRRRLTPRECANLQNFGSNFVISDTDFQAYKQFGNSLNVKIVDNIFSKLLKYL